MKTLKAITSQVGVSRFYAECEDAGWVPNIGDVATVPSPYHSGPTRAVYRWNGKRVIVSEVAHERYLVVELSPQTHIYPTDEAAERAFVAARNSLGNDPTWKAFTSGF
jgi:hypothetical protein